MQIPSRHRLRVQAVGHHQPEGERWLALVLRHRAWSLDDQGHADVSHGCINRSPADAEWFFRFTRPGDVVKVVKTPRLLAATNGFGDWNVAWADWVRA